MDAIAYLARPEEHPISCIEMHTTGEPFRIVISGYPSLSGTLLQQRAEAKAKHDHIRKRVMLEPAGHADMYGGILRQETELTESGEAHIGVLFIHGEGYSTMCGHGTIALGRFLVDTHDLGVFPRRNDIEVDQKTSTAKLKLHAPCGVVEVTVPVLQDGERSDPSRPVSFVSVPSFATGINVAVEIPPEKRWPQLKERKHLEVGFCYGGAFTCLASVQELGFESGLQQPVDIEAFDKATKILKDTINGDSRYSKYLNHPEHDELSALYTTMVVDKDLGQVLLDSKGAETGLCFFADQQIDRSPTGSAVAARVAYAFAKGELKKDESWTYHSLVSVAAGGKGGFVGTIGEALPDLCDPRTMSAPPIRIKVQGFAYYVGSHIFVAEKEDHFGGGGFLFDRLGGEPR